MVVTELHSFWSSIHPAWVGDESNAVGRFEDDDHRWNHAWQKIKVNPKSCYAYVRNKTRTKDKVGPLKDDKDNLINDDSVKYVQTNKNTFVVLFLHNRT